MVLGMDNPVADYKTRNDLSVTELAEKLGTSKGHISDLVNGNAKVGIVIAKRLSALTGKPWHKYL